MPTGSVTGGVGCVRFKDNISRPAENSREYFAKAVLIVGQQQGTQTSGRPVSVGVPTWIRRTWIAVK